MQKLHLVGFTTDQKGLILSARRGARSGSFHLPVDGELAEAVEELRERQAEEEAEAQEAEAEPARVPRVESALPVREIQARLRQGRSVQDVASAAGVDPAWVERFAAPVFAEQAQVVAEVQGTPLRRARLGASTHSIGDAVRHNLVERGVDLSPEEFAAAWSTRQHANGRWAVRFTYRHRGKHQVLRYDLDEAKGTVVAADRISNQLGYVAPPPGTKPPAAPRPVPVPGGELPAPSKRATVTTGFRAEPTSKATSRPAKERERANAAMRKAAMQRAAEAERAAARKARERDAAAARRARERQAEEARKERERQAEEARKARERAKAERAKAAAKKKKAVAAKRRAAEKAKQRAAKQAADQARRAEAALAAAERAAARKAEAQKATARKATKKKAAAKSTGAKRPSARKAPAKRAATKKRSVRPAPAKKAAATRTPAKPATAPSPPKATPSGAGAMATSRKAATKPTVAAKPRPGPSPAPAAAPAGAAPATPPAAAPGAGAPGLGVQAAAQQKVAAKRAAAGHRAPPAKVVTPRTPPQAGMRTSPNEDAANPRLIDVLPPFAASAGDHPPRFVVAEEIDGAVTPSPPRPQFRPGLVEEVDGSAASEATPQDDVAVPTTNGLAPERPTGRRRRTQPLRAT